MNRLITRVGRKAFMVGLVLVILTGCAGMRAAAVQPTAVRTLGSGCPVTEPSLATPPEDAAVQGEPAEGYYFINGDRSIWASAWYAAGAGQDLPRVTEEGIKVGWFRPAGAALEITGRRLDAQAAPLEAHVPCCYPTRFQATGLYFPTEGCWEVTAKADGSVLVYILEVYSSQ